jgi:aminoglycoside phosphotransferase family enzyme
MNEKQIKELVESTRAELVETHISWVLLSGDTVYKIKKPIKFSFLDFSTLKKRKFLCEEEVRLNRRLSPDIYLGVVPVSKDSGTLSLGGEGEAIGYAVKMKRLAQESRMDLLLQEGKVTEDHIREISGIVVGFHQEIEVINDTGYSSAEVVKRQIDDLGEFRDAIEEACGLGEKVDASLEACDSFIEKNKELFEQRQSEGKIRDCHGDLHSANIFITDRIIIFDCIEFSKDFRFIDTASEIAFMAMDLDAFGREDFSQLFVETYIRLSKDGGIARMLPIYLCYRANVRAKIAAIDFQQHPGEEPKERMRKYVLLAERYSKMLR